MTFKPVRALLLAGVLVATTAAVTTRVVSQEGIDDAFARYAMPGPQHGMLDRLAGTWDLDMQMWPSSSPTAQVMEARLTADYRWILGGRFLVGTYKGFIGGENYEARELLGYDSYREEFTQIWADNKTTAFTIARGQAQENGNKLVFQGAEDDVERNQRDQPFKLVYNFATDTEVIIELHKQDRSGTMYRRAEVRATRYN